MDIISAKEHELISFFEVLPQLLDDSPWPYNDYSFEVMQGSLALVCAIAPACRDVRLILRSETEIVFELNAVGVDDVSYTNEGGLETLTIKISQNTNVQLRIKPNILIVQTVTEDTDD